MLGECYYYGVGVEKDVERAFALYAEAAHSTDSSPAPLKCHAHLFLALAQCYEKGIGTPKDAQRAIAAYKSAAEHGDEEALYRVGRAIVAGVGMRSEYPAARTCFLRAARHGYMPAMLMMGIFSEGGKGVNKNQDDAKRWYSKAVTSKASPKMSLYNFPERFAEGVQLYSEAKTEAQYRFGMMISRTNPTAQIQIRAFEYIAVSAAMGYAPARREITKIHLSGGDLKSYYESPFSNENALFAGGHTEPTAKELAIAMYKLGDAFFDGKGLLKKNEEASANCYKFSAELGMVDACYSYGWCLRHGVGTDENDAEAVKWLKLAADRGNASAAYSYGLCCEEGAGMGVKNKREAMYYYRAAAASGHTEAAKRYVMLSSRGE
jgi:TPR repeat protein